MISLPSDDDDACWLKCCVDTKKCFGVVIAVQTPLSFEYETLRALALRAGMHPGCMMRCLKP